MRSSSTVDPTSRVRYAYRTKGSYISHRRRPHGLAGDTTSIERDANASPIVWICDTTPSICIIFILIVVHDYKRLLLFNEYWKLEK
jgi:hypothetical protein